MLLPILISSLLCSPITLSLTAQSLFTLLLGGNPPQEIPLEPPAPLINLTGAAEAEEWINRTFSFESSINLSSYLQALGIGFFVRQLALAAKPTVVLTRNCSLAQNQGVERKLSSEGKEERELHNVLEEKEDKEEGDNVLEKEGEKDDKVLKKNNKEEGDGDSSCLWSLTTDAGISRHTTVFTLGIPVTDKTVDGRRVTRLFTRIPESKNRLVEEQTSFKGGYKNTTVVRSFFPDKMEVNMWVGEVRASSVFRRVEEEEKEEQVQR